MAHPELEMDHDPEKEIITVPDEDELSGDNGHFQLSDIVNEIACSYSNIGEIEITSNLITKMILPKRMKILYVGSQYKYRNIDDVINEEMNAFKRKLDEVEKSRRIKEELKIARLHNIIVPVKNGIIKLPTAYLAARQALLRNKATPCKTNILPVRSIVVKKEFIKTEDEKKICEISELPPLEISPSSEMPKTAKRRRKPPKYLQLTKYDAADHEILLLDRDGGNRFSKHKVMRRYFDGYSYSFRVCLLARRYWRCTNKKGKQCRATLVEDRKSGKIWKGPIPHSHMAPIRIPDPQKTELKVEVKHDDIIKQETEASNDDKDACNTAVAIPIAQPSLLEKPIKSDLPKEPEGFFATVPDINRPGKFKKVYIIPTKSSVQEIVAKGRRIAKNLEIPKDRKCPSYLLDPLPEPDFETAVEDKTPEGNLVNLLSKNKFASRLLLKEHLKSLVADPVNQLYYECKICGERSLSRNFPLYHATRGNCGVPCYFCDETFENGILMHKHMQAEHSDRNRCEICGKCFIRHSQLILHLSKHPDFICDVCNYQSTTLFLLSKHKLRHFKKVKLRTSLFDIEKPWCSTCSIKFESDKHLEVHNRIKHKDSRLSR